MAKETLRERLTRDGYTSREIEAMLISGKVLVNQEVVTSGARRLDVKDDVQLVDKSRYPARSAYKLLGALRDMRAKFSNLHPIVKERICLDLGASHGGFTRVLLDEGARHVYALDVAYGILDYSLRQDERVTPLERTNVRDLSIDLFSEEHRNQLKKDRKASGEDLVENPLSDLSEVDDLFVVCDLSFISLLTAMKTLVDFGKKESISFEGIFLLKPQFEASDKTEKGIIKNDTVREEIILDVLNKLESLGVKILHRSPSRLKGNKGNLEETVYCRFDYR